MLQTKDLAFAYRGQSTLHFPDIQCLRGEQWLLLGQSGSGKTTLLHLLGGLRTAKQGEVIVNDQNLSQLRGGALDRFRGQNIGIVFQQAHFVRSLNIKENLLLTQRLAGTPTSVKQITNILERLHLGHKLKARPENLSQGEKQRVAIARALVNKPGLILADEPTSALDDTNCFEVIRLLEDQAKEENATLLIVTHDNRLKKVFEKQITLSSTINQ